MASSVRYGRLPFHCVYATASKMPNVVSCFSLLVSCLVASERSLRTFVYLRFCYDLFLGWCDLFTVILFPSLLPVAARFGSRLRRRFDHTTRYFELARNLL